MAEKVWDCKVGIVDAGELPPGADLPMREAVERAFRELTGREPDVLFSGWGGSLSEVERAAQDNRMPDDEVWKAEIRAEIDRLTVLLSEVGGE